MNAIQIDQLPDLCLKKIFRLLNLRDLAKCRAVSRQFKFYAEKAPVDELVVIGGSCAYCRDWYLTNKPIDFENTISLKAFKSVQSSPFELDQLQFLHIHLSAAADWDSKILNGFSRLAHLEIKSSAGNNRPLTLTLPNLKTLDFSSAGHSSYVLKTPKLEVLKCDDVQRIQVEHPERIKLLECHYSGTNHMAKFKGLERLEFRLIGSDLEGVRLSDWKELKELMLNMATGCYDEENYEDFQNSLVDLERQKTALKRDALKLYLNDVLLTDVNKQLLDWEDMDAPDFFRFKNYRHLRLDSYPKVEELDFVHLADLDVDLSADFFGRFPAIEYLTASGPVNQEEFEWFVRNAKAVRSLTLTNSSLDQEFFDSLPKLNSSLTHLQVFESSGLVTHFDFILQLEQLEVFETDRQLDSLDLPEKAFRQLNELAIFEFRKRNEAVVIERFGRVKNSYGLEFLTVQNNEPCSVISHQKELKWADLATLYDQRKAAGRKKGAKRQRLE